MSQKIVKIAIVEDDENLRFLISKRLKMESYEVLEIASGKEATTIILKEDPLVVLLDWMLPGKSGAVICQELREAHFEKQIIMMTAKGQDIDKINAYKFGISDYIIKPFNTEVLLALLENKVKFEIQADKGEVHKFGDMEHFPNIHTLIKNGERLELTILENRILLHFLKHQNQIVKRDDLMLMVWGYNSEVNTRTLDMHIVRLRKKIEVNPERPNWLITVRGEGYLFQMSPKPNSERKLFG